MSIKLFVIDRRVYKTILHKVHTKSIDKASNEIDSLTSYLGGPKWL